MKRFVWLGMIDVADHSFAGIICQMSSLVSATTAGHASGKGQALPDMECSKRATWLVLLSLLLSSSSASTVQQSPV